MLSIPQPGRNASEDTISGRGKLKAIANHCGRAEGHDNVWKCCCPVCGKHSLSVTPKLSFLVYCHYCADTGRNDGHTEQRERLVDAGLIDPDENPPKWDKEAAARHDAKRRAEACARWNHPWLEPVTPDRDAAKYLNARGIGAFIGHPAMRCLGGMLLARVWHVQYGLSAVQYTPLTWDCTDRDRSEHRTTVGVLKGGGVWIGAPKPDEWVVVGEGLETTLSAILLMEQRRGVAVLGSHYKDLVLPSTVRKLLVAVDNDETGRETSAHAVKLWRQRGLTVRVAMPDNEGEDFNDVLLTKLLRRDVR
jgi:hypothetical protein